MTDDPQAIAPATSDGLTSLFEMLKSGGPVIWPLGLLSLIAVAFAVERAISLRTGTIGGAKFGKNVVGAMNAEGAKSALQICQDAGTAMARVLYAGLKREEFPLVERDKAVEDAGLREVRRLSANLRPLLVVAVISPLLGLLGTVWGMILAFGELANSSGKADAEALANGISQALTTTAVGLAIAIPSQAAYYWYRSRIDKFIRNVEHYYHEISEIMVHGPQEIEPEVKKTEGKKK
ncbi:MAG: MotA/TolQ/ExbB proton channel family protein [Planctomycetes bacterium]|nr:MotA/TolQ/ExbB proton channel family protein [Planctomycetota bacterium]NQU50576.1 MotA/TolQ/ExbB proton channel family protein [Planctomycetota bacterium]